MTCPGLFCEWPELPSWEAVMPFPSPFFQRLVLGTTKRCPNIMVRPAPPTPWRARAFHLMHRNQTFRSLLAFAGQTPAHTRRLARPFPHSGRSFFALAFLAWLNVPFTTRPKSPSFHNRRCPSHPRRCAISRPCRIAASRALASDFRNWISDQ